jgi:RimJ/RimL family protein N-acetyltransferase
MRNLIDDRSRDREIGEWISQKIEDDYQDGDICFAVERDGELIAGVFFTNWNGSNLNMHLRCDDKNAMNYPFLRRIYEWGFVDVGANRITGIVVESNTKSIKAAEKMGFIREATLVNFLPKDSVVFMVMFPENCKYLLRN